MNKLINLIVIVGFYINTINAMEHFDNDKKSNTSNFKQVNLDFSCLSENLFLEMFSNSITSISIDKISLLEKVLSMSPNLNKLDLSETNSIDYKDIAKILYYPNITSLNLNGHILNVDCINEIKKLTFLKHLDISKGTVDNMNVISQLRSLTSLVNLNVDNVTLISDKKG